MKNKDLLNVWIDPNDDTAVMMDGDETSIHISLSDAAIAELLHMTDMELSADSQDLLSCMEEAGIDYIDLYAVMGTDNEPTSYLISVQMMDDSKKYFTKQSLTEDIERSVRAVIKEYMDNERRAEMYVEPNEEMKRVGKEHGYTDLEVERGYGIYEFDQTGILIINRFDCMYVGTGIDKYDDVTDEVCAAHANESGYCKIIPVNELPLHMMHKGEDKRCYGYIDTPENRQRIWEYFKDQNETIKLHARVTREIEVTLEQAEKLVNYLCYSSENNDVSEITELFTEGINSGDYDDAGYIPNEWLIADLTAGLSSHVRGSEPLEYLNVNYSNGKDIDL